ncbi:MAG TPA: helix-turn-helix domain-containing protein [Acidobacteriaceae bacterium]|jgi:AraC-like DNA-binding protein|nr:helix-turn-helix domain-containing protein [Acidobacteriaceae bacterium]
MLSRRYIPGPPLSDFIGCLWYWEGAPGPHTRERLLPNGEAAVIFNLLDEPIRIYNAQDIARYADYGNAVFSGARSDCFVIDANQQERVIGIQFLPGGAFPFFRMPVSEMEGASVSLDDLWPRQAAEIREQLLAAPDVDTMLYTLERCLLQRFVRPPELHDAVTFALRHIGGSATIGKIAAITDRIGLSSRRFIQVFHQQVGLTPKAFCRVRRFQRVLQSVHRVGHVDWAQVALDCGYYDQAHCIHDFRAFSGLTPSQYHSQKTDHLNHVPIVQ